MTAAGGRCVVLTGNSSYLGKCLFIAKLLRSAGFRHDINIFTDDPGHQPDVDGVILREIEISPDIEALPAQQRLGRYAFWRIPAIDSLSSAYDRILYLDADVVPALPWKDDIFDVDLGQTAVGAVWDFTEWFRPWLAAKEFRILGWEDRPYFNSGVLLIDCSAWRTQDILSRCLSAARDHAEAIVQADQSLLNIALRNNWTELNPVWNWQWSRRSALAAGRQPPQLIHFIGPIKPWNDAAGVLPASVRNAWAEHERGSDLSDFYGDGGPSLAVGRTPDRLLRDAFYSPFLAGLRRRATN